MEAGPSPPWLAACAPAASWCHMAHGARALGGLSWETLALPGQVREGKRGARDELEVSERLVWLQRMIGARTLSPGACCLGREFRGPAPKPSLQPPSLQ